MTKEKVQKFIKHSVFDDVRHIGKWNESEVWEPYFSDGKPRFLGFPQFILVKGDNIRWTADNTESNAIMRSLWA